MPAKTVSVISSGSGVIASPFRSEPPDRRYSLAQTFQFGCSRDFLRLVAIALALISYSRNSTAEPLIPGPYKQLRYDENYQYLSEEARRTDILDGIKYIPLNREGSSYLTLGGEIRERYEYFNNSLWGRGPQDSGGYLLQRYMFHADAHFGEAFRVFAQFKSGLEDGRTGGPRPTDRDEFDLHQAFFDTRIPLFNTNSLTLRIGRQELAYGSSRLISVRESPNVRLSFDGAKAILKISDWQVDAFAVKPVRTRTGVLDDDPDPKQKFWGLYGVTPVRWLPGGHVDLCYLGLERQEARFDQATAHEVRHTVGSRIWGRRSGWDYNLEFVYQFGSFGPGEIQAWTAASDTGYTFEQAPLKPRLALKANATSGDNDPKNPDLQTFNPLFPRGAYFGEPALIGPANHIDLHPELDLHLPNRIDLTLCWDVFWRESTHDGIYGPAVNLLQSGQHSDARFVGQQAEALLEWSVNRHFTVSADYAHFFTGAFLRQTTPGKDVDYTSLWLTFKF